MGEQTRHRLTPAEYLVMERASEEKHEYLDGEVFAMNGASLAHNRIVSNLVRELGRKVRGKPCEALPSDMRVHIPDTGL